MNCTKDNENNISWIGGGYRLKGYSHLKRVREVNAIYDRHRKSGASNRAIWRTHVYPLYYISERTFYNYIRLGVQ